MGILPENALSSGSSSDDHSLAHIHIQINRRCRLIKRIKQNEGKKSPYKIYKEK